MSVLTIAVTTLRRIARDRTALFFIVALPVLVILLVGATIGDFDRFEVGVIEQDAGPLSRQLVNDLEHSSAIDVTHFDDLEAARNALRRVEISAVVVVPAGMDADLRAGRPVEIPVLGEQADTTQRAARSAVAAVVARQAERVQAAAFTTEDSGGSFDANLERVATLQRDPTPITVRTRIVNATSDFLPDGFTYSAPTMLVLFVFINALAGGAALIETRQLGIHARIMAAPVSPRRIIAGETLSYFGIALLQSVLIVGVGALVFGVDWGNPVAAAALIATWALVGAGAGMLAGTLFRTPEQASSIGPALGITFGMLGGCMWPLEIVPSFMQRIGHLVPHAWAVDGWIELLSRGGGLTDIGAELAILAGFAAGLFALASLRLRSSLSS